MGTLCGSKVLTEEKEISTAKTQIEPTVMGKCSNTQEPLANT